ncbi:MAG: polysaccharide deacetylase family protein [Candidatus Krumholzibacteriia bacterium]
MAAPRIPVVMYHGIGPLLPGWLWGTLITPVDLFVAQIALLERHGYAAIDLDEYAERAGTGSDGRRPEVVLTFDDGYLDNWVYAYPILERAGWRGTIYVNPEFIDPGEEPRPTLKDVWSGRCSERDLPAHGFLNRTELRLLQESGVMTIASHSLSHTWYPTGPAIEDYHRPGLVTPWLAWNARPERKYAYLDEDQSGFVPWGTPIHRHGRALAIRRWLPDPAIAEAAVAAVATGGGESFFARPDWRPTLDAATAPLAGRGRLETDDELEQRYRHEIFESRRVLEEIVGAPVRHFCWPGGAYNDTAWRLAEEAGYRTVCVGSRDPGRRSTAVVPVPRTSCGAIISLGRDRYRTADPAFLHMFCELERGNRRVRWPLRLRKAMLAVRHGFRPVKRV